MRDKRLDRRAGRPSAEVGSYFGKIGVEVARRMGFQAFADSISCATA